MSTENTINLKNEEILKLGLKKIFLKQIELNNNTVKNWDQKNLNWTLAIHQEIAETIDSIKSWKWWKDINNIHIDLENIKLELIDILHFQLSAIMNNFIINKVYKNANEIKSDIDLIINNIVQIMKYNSDINIKTKNEIIDNIKKCPWDNILINTLFEILKQHLLLYKGEGITDVNNIHNIPYTAFDNYYPLILNLFLMSSLFEDPSFESIFKLYLGKNVLNQFRQDNGYKEGTYKKTWVSTYIELLLNKNEIEDNEMMMHLINNELDFDEKFDEKLYGFLTTIYNNVIEEEKVK